MTSLSSFLDNTLISPGTATNLHRRHRNLRNHKPPISSPTKPAVSLSSREVVEMEAKYIVGTYARSPLVLASGKDRREGVPRHGGRDRRQLPGPLRPGLGGGGDGAGRHRHPRQQRLLLHTTVRHGEKTQVWRLKVQCGLGRTGDLWAHEAYGVIPDLMTLAKPLAGGLPIGAVLVTERVAAAISYGDHGSTFAGSPLVCHAALKVLDKIQEPEFLASVARKGLCLKELLTGKLGGNPHVKEVRGLGLIVGIELDVSATPLVDACRDSGLLVLTAGKGNVVRLVPPLIDNIRGGTGASS